MAVYIKQIRSEKVFLRHCKLKITSIKKSRSEKVGIFYLGVSLRVALFATSPRSALLRCGLFATIAHAEAHINYREFA